MYKLYYTQPFKIEQFKIEQDSTSNPMDKSGQSLKSSKNL